MVVINDCAAVHSNTRIDKFSFIITQNEQNTRRIFKTNITWPAFRTMRTRRISVIDRAFYGSGLNGQKDYFIMIAVQGFGEDFLISNGQILTVSKLRPHK